MRLITKQLLRFPHVESSQRKLPLDIFPVESFRPLSWEPILSECICGTKAQRRCAQTRACPTSEPGFFETRSEHCAKQNPGRWALLRAHMFRVSGTTLREYAQQLFNFQFPFLTARHESLAKTVQCLPYFTEREGKNAAEASRFHKVSS